MIDQIKNSKLDLENIIYFNVLLLNKTCIKHLKKCKELNYIWLYFMTHKRC